MIKKKKSKMKKWIVIVAVVAIGAFFGNKLLTPKPLSYESVMAKSGDIATYYAFSGNIEAKNREIIIASRAAQIDEILVEKGELIEEGKDVINPSLGSNIEAGMDGEVAQILVEENDQVTPGTKLMEIVDYVNLMVSVKVDEFDLDAVQVGDEVLVKVTSLNKEIKGTISSISKEGQIISGVTYFIAEVDLEVDDTLKVGMSTEITLLAKESLGVVTLPMEAISFESDNTPYVLKPAADGAVVKEAITTGISDGMKVEILSGVTKDETVLYPKAAAMGFGPGMGDRIGGDNEGGGN